MLPAVVGVRRCAASPARRRSTSRRRTTRATCGRSATRPRSTPRSPRPHHVTRLDIVNNRLIPNAIEPRAAVASYSRADESYTLYVTSQNPHVERLLMTAFVLGLPEHKVRVIAPDVGGGFGSKIFLYAEETAMVWAAKHVNRPIKWTAERSESFISDAHGRDHVTHAELALDKDGKFLAMRVTTTANLGAYLSTFASCIPTILYATLLAGPVHDAGDLLRGRPRCSPTPCRSTPIAARDGPRRPTSSSAWCTRRRVEMGIAAGRDPPPQFHPHASRIQTPVALHVRHRRLRRDARRGDEARGRRRLRGAQGRSRAARQAARASATRRTSRRADSRRRTSRARSARAPACTRPARCACNPDRQRHGVHRLAQPRPGTRDDVRAGRRGPARHRRSTTSRSCTATPAACRSAWAPTARARSRSAARRS